MAASPALITLDGSHGEGGGALVRTALTMAALTQQPVRIDNIRENSRYPGLDAEDLTIVRALQETCQAESVGAALGSPNLSFLPTRRPRGLNGPILAVRNESGRGPNANIVLGTLLPVLARSGVYSSVSTEGETYGANSLCYESFANVTLPALKKLGLYAFPELVTGGFGRESAGTVNLDVEPSALTGVHWVERGRLVRVEATVVTSGVPESVAERAASYLKKLAQGANIPLTTTMVQIAARQTGVHISLNAHYERAFGGGAAMGSRGMRVEAVAQLAFEELFQWMQSSATVDPYLADQLLLPLAITEEESVFTVSRLTSRFLTCVWVIKQFTPIHITVKGSENGHGTVTIRR